MALIIDNNPYEEKTQGNIGLPTDDEHAPIILDLNTRTFSPFVDANGKAYVVAVEGDKNSQKITFHIPPEYEGIDLYGANCSIAWETSWRDDAGNISKAKISLGAPIIIGADGNNKDWALPYEEKDMLEFDWYLDERQCAKAGSCAFRLFFEFDDSTEDTNEVTGSEGGYVLSSKAGVFKIDSAGIIIDAESAYLELDVFSPDDIRRLLEEITIVKDETAKVMTYASEMAEKANQAAENADHAAENAETAFMKVAEEGKIPYLKNQNLNRNKASIWTGTLEEYNNIDELSPDTIYMIEDMHTQVDYIIEQGKTGIWTWRKWNGGIFECWGELTHQETFVKAAGSGIYISTSMVDLPIVSTTLPVGAGAHKYNFGSWVNVAPAYKSSTEIDGSQICVMSFQTQDNTLPSTTVTLYVKGTWK